MVYWSPVVEGATSTALSCCDIGNHMNKIIAVNQTYFHSGYLHLSTMFSRQALGQHRVIRMIVGKKSRREYGLL